MKKVIVFLFVFVFGAALYAQDSYLAGARLGKEWGFVDKGGKWAINPQFENVKSFNDGLARAKKNGQWGLMLIIS
jgi:hypothetical protein